MGVDDNTSWPVLLQEDLISMTVIMDERDGIDRRLRRNHSLFMEQVIRSMLSSTNGVY